MKGLIEGYVGVKFEAIQLVPKIPSNVKNLFPLFKENGQRLNKFGMTPKNGGNMSMKTLDGIACETFSKDQDIIVLKNHGYVAIGKSLREATDLVIKTHIRLVA